jgi:hypothetical protein
MPAPARRIRLNDCESAHSRNLVTLAYITKDVSSKLQAVAFVGTMQ